MQNRTANRRPLPQACAPDALVLRQAITLAVTLVALVVNVAAVHAGVTPEEARITEDNVASFAIPKMDTPPTIDGVIDEAEWQSAGAMGGLVEQSSNVMIPRPTTFFLGWDDGHLYMACRSYLPANYKPQVPAGRSEGLAYVWDDGLELHFKPEGSNVLPDKQRSSYKLFLNALGFTGDLTHLSLGQQFKSWAPRFDIATRLTEPGTAPNGGRWWELELSSTPEDFDLDGPHRAGNEWKIMLGANHMPKWMQARLPAMGSYLDAFGYGVYTLVEDQPAVQMRMDTLQNVASGEQTGLAFNVYNPTPKPTDVRISIDVANQLAYDQTHTIKPGQQASFDYDKKLQEAIERGHINVRITSADSAAPRELLQYFAYFQPGKYDRLLRTPKAREEGTFAFSTTFNPVASTALVKADTYNLPDPEAAAKMTYRVQPTGSDSIVAEGTVTDVSEWYFQKLVQLPPLEPGMYDVFATLHLKDGSKLGPMQGNIEKKDEANEFAHWWDSDAGDIEKVIWPFTGVSLEGDAVSVWGRTYQLNALGLPAAITSQGEAVHSAPSRIVAVIDGKEHSFDLSGKPTITSSKDYRVDFTGQVTGAGLRIKSEGWVEQDGLCFISLTYEPTGKPVNVEQLRIEYPLAEDDADALLCVGPGANYSSRTTKLLDKESQGQIWSTLETGRTGSGMTVGSFYPTVWVGSDRRGLMWWGDNDKGWLPQDDVPAHEVVRRGEQVVLVNNIIGSSANIDRARTLEFGYMASPFRPLPEGWRATIATENGTFFEPYRSRKYKDSKTGKQVIPKFGHNNWAHPASRYPEEWADMYAKQKPKADAAVKRKRWADPYESRRGFDFQHISFQLMGYGVKSAEQDVWDYFGPAWLHDSHEIWGQRQTNYMMHLLDRIMTEGGLRTTYWDLTFPILTTNLQTGHAYRLPDGRVQRGYNGFNCRRFFMRLYALSNEHGLNPGGVGVHSSNAYLTVAMPWVDSVLDGERDWDLDSSPLDWVDNMPIERMRAMSVPHNWGVGICWMSNFTANDRADVGKAKTMQAEYVWLHDMWRNPYIAPGPREMPQAVLDWGLNEPGVTYHPYWRNTLVTTDDPDVLVSLWELPDDRVLIGVFNYNGKKAKNVDLAIDLESLGLVPEKKWQQFVGVRDLYGHDGDRRTAAQLDFHEGKLSVPKLEPHALRLIGVRRY